MIKVTTMYMQSDGATRETYDLNADSWGTATDAVGRADRFIEFYDEDKNKLYEVASGIILMIEKLPEA